MAMVKLGGIDTEVDEDGYIQQPEVWTKEMADDLAKTEDSYPLSENSWKIVNYLRDYYIKFEIAPPVRMLCKETGFSLKEIYEMFPGGPAKSACKVAGLPKPTGCL